MAKKIILCLSFFMISPLILGLSFWIFAFFNQDKVLGTFVVNPLPSSKVYAALPGENPMVAYQIQSDDGTPIMIENYLRRFNSPLLPYVDKILEAAQKHQVKPQLILAIAQQESNLGKKSPVGCFNAWGWGIHAKGTKCYSSWEEAIESVTQGIAKDYCAKGYCDEPCVMMRKYTPRSNGSWCFGVNQFLREMETGEF